MCEGKKASLPLKFGQSWFKDINNALIYVDEIFPLWHTFNNMNYVISFFLIGCACSCDQSMTVHDVI